MAPPTAHWLGVGMLRKAFVVDSSPDVSVQDREDGGEQVGRKVAKKT